MILCCSKIAEEPYSFSSASVKIFSLEEFCSLCLEDPFWIDQSLFTEPFTLWLKNQLGMDKTSEELEQLIQSKADCDRILACLFDKTDYLSEQEQTKIIFEVSQNQSISLSEKRLRYGDRQFKNQEYKSAVLEYIKLLSDYEDTMTKEMKARVYFNLAASYGKLLDYEQAVLYFGKSNELIPREQTQILISELSSCMQIKISAEEKVPLEELTKLKNYYRKIAR